MPDQSGNTKGLMSWLRSWGSPVRKNDQGQKKIQATKPQLELAKQQLEQATGEKEILIQRGHSLQQELDSCIERKQRRVDMYDDLTNDALGLSWHMTKSLRELKSALEFNDEVLSMSNKRRSSSRAESTVSVLAVPSSSSQQHHHHQQQQQQQQHQHQQKLQTQRPAPAPSALSITPPGDDSRPAEPAVWHGYKGAESMILGPHSPTKKGMIHFARSPATSSLLSMMAAMEPTLRPTEPSPPGDNATLSQSTACAASLQLPPPSPCHRIDQHLSEDSAASPVTSTGSCSGSSGDSASEGSHEDGTFSCGSSLASDGDAPPLPALPSLSDNAETDCCDVISLRSRSTTPAISISKEVLNAHALATAAAVAASSPSVPAASVKPAGGSPIIGSASFSLQRRRSSCSFSSATQACVPLNELVGGLASSSGGSSNSTGTSADAEFASLAAQYSECWSVFSAAQTVIDTLRMCRDSQRAFLSGARRLRDSLGSLSRGVVEDFEAEEDEIKFILSYDFDLGGRIHESFSCKVRGASSSCRLKGSGASSSSTSALASSSSSSSSAKSFSFRRGSEVPSSGVDQPPPRGLTRSRSLSFKSVTSLIPSPFRRKPSVDSGSDSPSSPAPAPAPAPATPTAASRQATSATSALTAAPDSPERSAEDPSAPATNPSSPLHRAGACVEQLRRAISEEQQAREQVERLTEEIGSKYGARMRGTSVPFT